MASKKGIALTVGIAAAIVGSSFLIWYIPQSSPGALTDEGIISDIYSRHQNLALDIDSEFEQWKEGQLTSEELQTRITAGITETIRMKTELAGANPAQEWQESYDLYGQALDSFEQYLDAMQANVDEGNKADDPELESLKLEWEGYVDDSVSAMPV